MFIRLIWTSETSDDAHGVLPFFKNIIISRAITSSQFDNRYDLQHETKHIKMKLFNTILPLIVGAASANAKKLKGGKVETKFCYRDGATATASVSLSDSESYDYDAAAAWIDMGHFKIEDDEALLVEATVETLWKTYLLIFS